MDERLKILALHGLIGQDAETALAVYDKGPPYGSDAGRVACVLRSHPDHAKLGAVPR